jgi:hypothetical protein
MSGMPSPVGGSEHPDKRIVPPDAISFRCEWSIHQHEYPRLYTLKLPKKELNTFRLNKSLKLYISIFSKESHLFAVRTSFDDTWN